MVLFIKTQGVNFNAFKLFNRKINAINAINGMGIVKPNTNNTMIQLRNESGIVLWEIFTITYIQSMKQTSANTRKEIPPTVMSS